MRTVLLLALALATAGCTSSNGPMDDHASGDEHADDHYPPSEHTDFPVAVIPPSVWQLAIWNQSDVLDAMPTSGVHGGYTVGAQALDDVIPFEHAGLADRYGALVLYEVWWEGVAREPASASHREFFILRSDLHIGALLEDRHDEEAIHAMFAEFAANVTGAGADIIEEWADDFLAAQRDVDTGKRADGTEYHLFGYDVAVGRELIVGELIDQVDGHEGLAHHDARTTVELVGPTWSFLFYVPSVTAVRAWNDVAVSITATSRDEVLLVRAATSTVDEDHLQDAAEEAFTALELTAPSFSGWHVRELDRETYGTSNLTG